MTDDRQLLAEALPRYEIGEEIGRGGWGVVYRGEHRELGRSVAIKQLARTVIGDPNARDRFVAEARLIAGLEHPHIVPVYDFVEHEGMCAIVMELASGGTLSERFRNGLRTDQAVAVALAIAVGLHHAHTNQLLHRDVKPDNVLFTSETVKIADFGIAKVLGADAVGHTATGAIIGTPSFMAPEQVQGAELTAATDTYALAVMVYQLLSGDLPYPATGDAMSQLYQTVHEQPRPLAELCPDVDRGVAAVIHRAMAKNPLDRPPTTERFAVELAAAASAWFGPGWLARSGIAVMGSNAVIAAAEQAGLAPGERTAIGQGGQSDATVLVRPDGAGDGPPSSQSKSRLGWLVAGGALAVILLVAAVWIARGGGDDPTTAVSTDQPLSDSELASFRSSCVLGGVSAGRCGCVAERAATQLEPAVFRQGFQQMLAEDGDLTDELKTIFEACVADGF